MAPFSLTPETTNLQTINQNEDMSASKENTVPETCDTAITSQQQLIKKKSSFQKFSRSSSKKKRSKTKSDSDTETVLNNGREPQPSTISSQSTSQQQQFRKTDNLNQTPNRIQNDTKDTNKISPQNSFRQTVAARRSSAMINNSQQLLDHLNRHTSDKNLNTAPANNRRRMSSIEQVFEKTSNINLCNLENMKASTEFISSKIDLANIQKSLTNLHEAESSTIPQSGNSLHSRFSFKALLMLLRPHEFIEQRDRYSLYIFAEDNGFVSNK